MKYNEPQINEDKIIKILNLKYVYIWMIFFDKIGEIVLNNYFIFLLVLYFVIATNEWMN